MKTPPNSFDSDYKMISPGSSDVEDYKYLKYVEVDDDNDDLEDYKEIEKMLGDAYIRKKSPLYFSNWKEDKTLHKKNLGLIERYKNEETIEINCSGEIIKVKTVLAPILSAINMKQLYTKESYVYNQVGYGSIVFTLEGYDKWSDLLIEKAKEKYGENNYYDYDLFSRFKSTEDKKNLTNFVEGIHWEAKDDSFVVVWKFMLQHVDEIYQEIYDLFE